MSEIWFISDTHFGHDRLYGFINNEGNRVRDFAESAREGEELMVKLWNERVKPEDFVIHLGDVAVPEKGMEVMRRLMGRKILVAGNHDTFPLATYAEHFEDVKGMYYLENAILSHAPIHDAAFSSRGGKNVNLHGHIHNKLIMKSPHHPDPRYMNLAVEQTGGRPVNLEEIKETLKCR